MAENRKKKNQQKLPWWLMPVLLLTVLAIRFGGEALGRGFQWLSDSQTSESTTTAQKVPTASMTVHPVRMTGLVVGAPQTYQYFNQIQEQIVNFVTKNSHISREDFLRYMMATDEIATDVGTVLYGEEAVSSGLMDAIGSLSDALSLLHRQIERRRKREKSHNQ